MKHYPSVYQYTFGTPEPITLVGAAQVKPCKEKLDALCDVPSPFAQSDIQFASSRRGISLAIPKKAGEHIYGFGLQLKSFEQTGKKRYVRVNADPESDCGDTHAPAPFYISDAGYAVLVDTLRVAKFYNGCIKKLGAQSGNAVPDKELGLTTDQLYSFKSGAEDRSIFVEIPACEGVDVYIFTGENMKDALHRYILFSGGGAMPPMWGLGYHYRVKSEYTAQQALELMDEFAQEGMPCDMLGLEPGWQTKAYSCSFLWEKDRFAQPESFMKQIEEKGVRLSLWEHAFTHPDSEMYEALKPYSSDFEVWEGLVPDFATREAKEIFGGYHTENLLKQGVAMLKLDECDSSDYTGGWSFPEFAEFPSGMDGEQYHAAFGMLYQQTILEGFESLNKRTWSMVRSTNALNAAKPFVLYSDLYDHDDFIRGLATAPLSGMLWSPEVRQCASVDDLIRRMQTTAIAPLMCANNWMIKMPAWKQFDYEKNLKGELLENWRAVFESCKKIVQLRMSLIPYYYEAFYEYRETGEPPVRPLLLDYPDDANVLGIDTQFMLGGSLMAAPCTQHQSRREIYFPAGNWYCFYTGKKYPGGQSVTVETPVDYLPLFVKEGAAIPVAEPVLHVQKDTVFALTLRVFGDKAAACRLYCDDGETNDYKTGAYSLITAEISEHDAVTLRQQGDYPNIRYTVKNVERFV